MPKILLVLDILFFPSPSLDIVRKSEKGTLTFLIIPRITRAGFYLYLSLYTGTYVHTYLEKIFKNILTIGDNFY
jgi:hypothetical protein